MQIAESIKRILTNRRVKIDVNREFSEQELLMLYEKVIVFVDRKLTQATSTINSVEVPCDENLQEVKEVVMFQIQNSLPSQLTAIYDIEYFKTHHVKVNELVVTLLGNNSEEYHYTMSQLWRDVLANCGTLPNVYYEDNAI